jgi:hypothetical protein
MFIISMVVCGIAANASRGWNVYPEKESSEENAASTSSKIFLNKSVQKASS